MSAGGASHHNGPQPPYVVWDTNGLLPPSNAVEEGMFTADFNQIYNSYGGGTLQLFDQVYNQGGLESNPLVPGSSLVPTQLPVANQLDLSLGHGLGLGGSGEVDPQATWEGEEDAMDFSTDPFEAQQLHTASSSNGSGSQWAEPRKPRKKEESGSCDVCSRSFSRRSDVRRHKNTAHGKEAHACPQCDVVCSRKDALRRHMRDQH